MWPLLALPDTMRSLPACCWVTPTMRSRSPVTVQTPGGCGGLRIAAEFIRQANPDATVWVSDPTWANHIPLLGSAGLQFKQYPYYDYDTHAVKFDEMLECLRQVPKGDLVLLHGCCHNQRS